MIFVQTEMSSTGFYYIWKLSYAEDNAIVGTMEAGLKGSLWDRDKLIPITD